MLGHRWRNFTVLGVEQKLRDMFAIHELLLKSLNKVFA